MKIRVERAVAKDCDRNWYAKNAISPFARLYFIFDGEAFLKINGEEIRLTPENVYLIPAHILFDVWCEKTMRQFYLHFRAELDNGVDFFHIYPVKYRIPLDTSPVLALMRQNLEDVFASFQPKNTLETTGYLLLALSLFLDRDKTPNFREKLEALERFKKIFEYMETHLTAKISLAKLAGLINLQSTYFSNLFCRVTGMPPIKYLNLKRLEKAQELLLTTNQTLAEIASGVGFEDVFYFSRLFKKYLKVAPKQYRDRKPFA